MTETSFPWGGIVTGDCGPYDSVKFTQMWSKLFGKYISGFTYEGVLTGIDNELHISNPYGSTLMVDSGAALVDGTVYRNTDKLYFPLQKPSAGTYTGYIVLRKDWASRTVRLALIGPSASPVYVQTRGSVYEIPLCNFSIDSVGVVTNYYKFGYPVMFHSVPRYRNLQLFSGNISDSSGVWVSIGAGYLFVSPGDFPRDAQWQICVIANIAGGATGQVRVWDYTFGGTLGSVLSIPSPTAYGYVASGFSTPYSFDTEIDEPRMLGAQMYGSGAALTILHMWLEIKW